MKGNNISGMGKTLKVLIYAALALTVFSIPFTGYYVFCVSWWVAVQDLSRALLWLGACWLCAGSVAVILWQAKKILDTVLGGDPFQVSNAKSMARASDACWVAAAVTLLRFGGKWAEGYSWMALVSADALFFAAFLMAGLLFRVMAALFYRAAQLQEDQDLTI